MISSFENKIFSIMAMGRPRISMGAPQQYMKESDKLMGSFI
jgi:hypothetical protein